MPTKTPLSKTIDGKRYGLGRQRKLKRSANNVAESYRREGYNARIVKLPNKTYGIYVRKKQFLSILTSEDSQVIFYSS